MKLLVLHPQILDRTCGECQKWLFDDEHRKQLRAGQPIARQPHALLELP